MEINKKPSKHEIVNDFSKVIAEVAFKLCKGCESREKCFVDTSGVPKTINTVMNLFRENIVPISSCATIELIKMMKKHQYERDR